MCLRKEVEYLGYILCLEGSIISKIWPCWVARVMAKILKLVLGRAEWEVCSATWILGTNFYFAGGSNTKRKILGRIGVLLHLPGVYWLQSSIPAFKFTDCKGSLYMRNRSIFEHTYVSQSFFMFLWLSNKQFDLKIANRNCIESTSPYRAANTHRLSFTNRPLNAV